MSLANPDEARELLNEWMVQPKQFLFGIDQAVYNTVLAMITPMLRDGDSSKEPAQAHVYLLDKPGRGKTALLKYLSAGIDAKLGRIDGRPDMMPSDLTGREDVDRVTGIRTLLKGPIHSNIVFFDEITRTPAKGQAIMLGAMEGSEVMMNITDLENRRIDSRAFSLYPISDNPDEKDLYFIVMATANPIEFVGTYELSEAQKERFTYSFRMGMPSPEDEMKIRAKNLVNKKVKVVMSLRDLLDISIMVSHIELSDQADNLIQRFQMNSRPYAQDLEEYKKIMPRHASSALVDFVNMYVANGCSPRRNLHMEAAAKAWAFMRGENELATADDVKAIASMTMEHVILLQPKSLGDNVTPRTVVQRIIDETEAVVG